MEGVIDLHPIDDEENEKYYDEEDFSDPSNMRR